MEELAELTLRVVGFLMGVFIVGALICAVLNVAVYAALVAVTKALLS